MSSPCVCTASSMSTATSPLPHHARTCHPHPRRRPPIRPTCTCNLHVPPPHVVPRAAGMRACAAFRRRTWKLSRVAWMSLFVLATPCILHGFPSRRWPTLPAKPDELVDWQELSRATASYCEAGGTLVCAHGGESKQHVVNTMEALQSALDGGVRCLEADAAATKDGQLVVLHTRELSQMMDVEDVQVGDFTWDEIQQLGIHKGIRVPKVEQVLARFAQKVDLLIVDVKTHSIHGKAVNEKQVSELLVNAVKKTDCSTCLAWSKSEDVIRKVQVELPSLPTGIVMKDDRINLGKNAPNHAHREMAKVIAYHHEMVDSETIAQVRVQDKLVVAWTANDRNSVRRLLDLGVYGLVTNFPTTVQKAVDERNKQCKQINAI